MLAAGRSLLQVVMSHTPLSRHPYIPSVDLRCDSNANLVGLHDACDDKVPTKSEHSEELLEETSNDVDEVDTGAESDSDCGSTPSSSVGVQLSNNE